MIRFRHVDCSIFSNAAVVFNTEVCLAYLDRASRALTNPSGRRIHCQSSTHPSGRGSHERKRGAMRSTRRRDQRQFCIYTYLKGIAAGISCSVRSSARYEGPFWCLFCDAVPPSLRRTVRRLVGTGLRIPGNFNLGHQFRREIEKRR